MKNLNDKVLELIKEANISLKDDPVFAEEIIRDLTRISKLILNKELKQFSEKEDLTC